MGDLIILEVASPKLKTDVMVRVPFLTVASKASFQEVGMSLRTTQSPLEQEYPQNPFP